MESVGRWLCSVCLVFCGLMAGGSSSAWAAEGAEDAERVEHTVEPAFKEEEAQARSLVQIPGTTIEFVAPPEFTFLAPEEVSYKFPRGPYPPKYVLGNAERSTTIAFDLVDLPNSVPAALRSEGLRLVSGGAQQGLERTVPGVRWVKRDIVSLAGQEWVWLELTSHALDTEIYNILLLTFYQDQMLRINFNATLADFAQLEPALRASIRSLRFMPSP